MTTQEQVRVRRGDAHEATGVPWVTLLGRSVVFSPSWTATQKGSSRRLSRLRVPRRARPISGGIRRGLRDYGYIERETILVEYRWADSQYDRLPQLAMELTRENVDLIVTYGSEGALAAKRTITTLPIVAVAVGDMVGAGVVANLARPEANVTGLSLLGTEVSEKRLSLLRDTIPDLGKVAIVWNPGNSSMALQFKAVEAAARTMGIEILDCHYSSVAEFTHAISVADRAGAEALFTADDAILLAHAIQMIELAREHRLPVVGEFREIAEAGGLWSYGPNLRDIYRRAAMYVDKILKRAKPRDLPVEQPTRFELVINLRTARVLGRELPPALLAHADQVIDLDGGGQGAQIGPRRHL